MKKLKEQHQQERTQLAQEHVNEMSELRNAKETLMADIQKMQESINAARAEATDIAEALRAKEAKIKEWELQAQAISFQYDSTLQSLTLVLSNFCHFVRILAYIRFFLFRLFSRHCLCLCCCCQ